MADDSQPPARHPLEGAGLVLNIVLLLLNIALFVVFRAPRPPEAMPPPATVVVPVTTCTVQLEDIPELVSYPGWIEANTNATLAAEQQGPVVWLGAEKGDAVEAGQLLLRIDSRTQAATVQRAEVALQQAAEDLRRAAELRKTGSIAQSDYETLVRHRDMAAIGLEQTRIDLARCELRSPIPGIVQARSIELGEYASPGRPVFQLVQLDRVKVAVDIPERDLFSLRRDAPVPVAIDSLPGRSFQGVLRTLAPAADPKSNTFRAEILLENPECFLKPGVIARITVTRRVFSRAITVPLQALIPLKGQHIAYAVEENRAVRRVVKLAAIVGDRAIVVEGLAPGDRVVLDGHRAVSDGIAVQEGDRTN